MDAVYIALAIALWLLMVAMAKGCSTLGGPEE